MANKQLILLTLEDIIEHFDFKDINPAWQTVYKLHFILEGDNNIESISDLIEMRGKSKFGYKKLLNTIKMQLGNKEWLQSGKRISPGKLYKEIYEMKSPCGDQCRLFTFRFEDKIIVATHGWWKNSNRKQQTAQFKKADEIRKQLLQQEK